MAVPVDLPAGWGKAALLPAGRHAPKISDTCRAYDHLGKQLVWQPAGNSRCACDVEQAARGSIWMARQFAVSSPGQFLRDWVCTEALAKLAGIPILVWLKERGLVRSSGSELEFEGATVLVKALPATGHVMAFASRETS